jgi:hypothetical protein
VKMLFLNRCSLINYGKVVNDVMLDKKLGNI